MSIVNLDKSLGNLRTVSSHELIEYEPFEFSRHCIGILSPKAIDVGTFLMLDSHRNGRIPFQITFAYPHGNLFRYKLVCRQSEENLVKKLDIDPRSGKVRYERKDNHLQYARFNMAPKMYVQTKTFGSTNSYVLESVDVSRTGILLCAPKPYGTIPFNEQTLVEIKLDVGTSWSDKTIEPLGKVVRIYTTGKGDRLARYYGVKFLEFSTQDTDHWNKVLENIEKAVLADNTYGIAA